MNKALSIKQPWALLIARGIKNIENRTWPTKYRGRVYIHASASKIKDHWSLLTQDQYKEAMNFFLKIDSAPNFELSAIIGHVDIVDCVENYSSIWAEHWVTEDWHNGVFGGTYDQRVYNWVLANPVLFDEPILDVKGKLSFWDCSELINRKEVDR